MGVGHTPNATELRAKGSAAVVEDLASLGGNCGGAVADRGSTKIEGEAGRDEEPLDIASMGMESMAALVEFPRGMMEAETQRCLLGLGEP